MADIFGGLDPVPGWADPDSRFRSRAAGNASARNFMDAYQSAKNRKVEERKFNEILRHNKALEANERERRQREAALEAERLSIERDRREAEIEEKSRRAKVENDLSSAAKQGAMLHMFNTGRAPTEQESAAIIANAYAEFDPVNYPLARQRLLGNQEGQFVPQVYTLPLPDGGNVNAITTSRGGVQVIPEKTASKEPLTHTIDILDERGNKRGTKKVTEKQFLEEEERRKKAESGKLKANEVERVTKDGRRAIFDAKTKQFIRYAD